MKNEPKSPNSLFNAPSLLLTIITTHSTMFELAGSTRLLSYSSNNLGSPSRDMHFLSLQEPSYNQVWTKLNSTVSTGLLPTCVQIPLVSTAFQFYLPFLIPKGWSWFLTCCLNESISQEFHGLPSPRHQLPSLLSICVVETGLIFLPLKKLYS